MGSITTLRAQVVMVLAALALASCAPVSGGPPETAVPGDSTVPPETTVPGVDPEPDQPPDGIGLVVDWSDSSKVLELDEGWTVRACEGDAPLLCVEQEGVHVGVVEALAHPIESYPDLDPTADTDTNLEAVARGFLEALRSDRIDGCGADYGFQPIEPEPIVLANTPGITYGFVGTTSSGPSELILQYSTIVGDEIVFIVAAAYDEGGCPGRDELSGFDSEALTRFRPYLEMVLHESPLPHIDT